MIYTDSCKWNIDNWNDTRSYEFYIWEACYFEEGYDPPPPIRKLGFRIGKDDPPKVGIRAVTDEGIGSEEWTELIYDKYLCALAPNPFSVTITNETPGCPINVTIVSLR